MSWSDSRSTDRDSTCLGGLLFEAHRLCVSLNTRLESNKGEEEVSGFSGFGFQGVLGWGVDHLLGRQHRLLLLLLALLLLYDLNLRV